MLFRAWGERQRRRRGDSALWRMNFFGEKPVGTERTETSRVDSYVDDWLPLEESLGKVEHSIAIMISELDEARRNLRLFQVVV